MSLWEQQWKLFAPGFKEGKAHISLSPYGSDQILRLLPGPGFGDFSHPTTRLTLRLMAPYVHHQVVIDIGCGSGILSLAAAALSAKKVYGYDIDLEAVEHATTNGQLNNSPATFGIRPPSQIEPHSILLMNMISSEQACAWQNFLPCLTLPARLFTSGVLDNHRLDYLRWAQENGWSLKQSLCESSWWAFAFDLPRS